MKKLLVILFIQLTFSQIEAEAYKIFLQKVDSNKQSHFSGLYLSEAESYLNLFPNNEKNAEILKSLADKYYADRNYHEALFYYLKSRTLYSSYKTEAISVQINNIVSNHEKSDYEYSADKIILAGKDTSTTALLDDQFRFITLLFEINEEQHYQHLIKEAKLFIKLFPHSVNTDKALIIIAKSYERIGEKKRALFYYELLLELIPSSDQQSLVYFQMANILSEYLDEHKKAVDIFTQLIEKDSGYELSHEAQFKIAKLYEDELDNKHLAIDAYENYLEKYPKRSYAVQSLERIAKIHDSKLEYDKTIAAYRRLVKQFPTDKLALFAQNQIVEILLDELGNYEEAAKELMRYEVIFPNNVKKDEYFLEAIELISEKVQDRERVLELCKSFLEKFPNSAFIDDVQELMSEE